jgi:uroporphyrinogen-III synthase
VGAETAAEARKVGFRSVISAEGDIASLVATIFREHAKMSLQGRLLHISGANQAGDLAGALSARGIAAERAIAYEARAIDGLSDAAAAAFAQSPFPEWAALFSPRSAALFLDQAGKAGVTLQETRAACLSVAVAKAAEAAAWRSVDIASERSGAALIRLMLGERWAQP